MELRKHLNPFIVALWKETDGQDLVEYALLLGFIAISTISILTGVRTSLDLMWSKISSALSSAAAS
jgi:Flp pilus assembly pilin Flp